MNAKADSGKMASVRYKGVLLKSTTGVPFDGNMDNPNKPLLMVGVGSVGTQNSVIPGLDQALRLFGKGGKGKVYIPAMAGYGDAGSPPVIPAYASLVFDIEIVDVATPPKAPVQPVLPNGAPRQ
jgi:FKBP-type peptidyl-prolyl cis-trans isomerase FkpA